MSEIIFSLSFTSHSASNSRVFEIFKNCFNVVMTSETQRWMAVENVVFLVSRHRN